MKNILIITVAGTSSRFSKSIGHDALKCIYQEENNPSILSIILEYSKTFFDKIIIVGGYKFEDLKQYINTRYNIPNIQLIYNEHYADYGSNYSLYLGLLEVFKTSDCQIVFAEGDLIVDKKSYLNVCNSTQSAVTATKDFISADKSVAFYKNADEFVRYIYDTQHEYLSVNEKFSFLANSGQIWKFTDINILKNILKNQKENDYKDTNLNIVQKYFEHNKSYKIITIEQWYNCNTVDDYREASKIFELPNEAE
ncbi:MAG: licC domain protein [Bacteroidales bacterium]|jgi:choline kinase|nr:licC domain protein [Bacteroidales bacterium]